jgi:hypothetical protein
VLRVRGFYVALHWLCKKRTDTRDGGAGSLRSKSLEQNEIQKSRQDACATRERAAALGFGSCAFNYAIDEQQDNGAYD